MATAHERVLAKYQWAKEHVDKFKAASESFRNEKPYSFTRETDTATGEYVYRMTLVSEIPERLRFMLGDALHNLRSALDHAAYAAVEAGSTRPNTHTYFPVSDSPDAYVSLVKSRIPGVGQSCYEVFDRIQPYKGGFGHWVWQIHKLDIIDKHRLLLAATSVPVGRTLAPSEVGGVGIPKRIIGPTQALLREMVFGHAPGTEVIRAVEAGDEIGRFPATEDYENVGFAFDISIDETEVIRGMPSYLMLDMFSSRVLKVINDLAAFM